MQKAAVDLEDLPRQLADRSSYGGEASVTKVEIFYDYVSPFSYLAHVQMDGLAERTGAELVYRPVLLGGIFKAAGNTSPIQDPCEAKRKHVMTTLMRWVKHHNAPMKMNPAFPLNSVTAMRCAVAAQNAGCFDGAHRAMFSAMWENGVDISDAEALKNVLDAAGLDGSGLLDATGNDDVKNSLKANVEDAISRGAYGAPTFLVGDALFWGQDQVTLLEDHLKAA
jgi:2-hydroxychromene-2-carboxylate isomerase